MRKRAHWVVAFGVVAPIAVHAPDFPVETAICLALGGIGGDLSDLDQPDSSLSRALWPINLIWWPVAHRGRNLLGLHQTLHRRGFHSYKTGLCIALLILLVGEILTRESHDFTLAIWPAGCFFVGWMVHWFLDRFQTWTGWHQTTRREHALEQVTITVVWLAALFITIPYIDHLLVTK